MVATGQGVKAALYHFRDTTGKFPGLTRGLVQGAWDRHRHRQQQPIKVTVTTPSPAPRLQRVFGSSAGCSRPPARMLLLLCRTSALLLR